MSRCFSFICQVQFGDERDPHHIWVSSVACISTNWRSRWFIITVGALASTISLSQPNQPPAAAAAVHIKRQIESCQYGEGMQMLTDMRSLKMSHKRTIGNRATMILLHITVVLLLITYTESIKGQSIINYFHFGLCIKLYKCIIPLLSDYGFKPWLTAHCRA